MKIAMDLDGTLADITHRLHFIQHERSKDKDWPSFFRASVDDKPIAPMIALAQSLVLAGHAVDIWSGRSDVVRFETEAWLNRHAIGYRTLRMRRDGDYRKDCIVKQEWLDGLPSFERPDIAFDDRQQVVDMWRRNGIRCAQVAPGDF
jgi:hypothetical protein